MNQQDVELYRNLQSSPILFIEKVWKLVPQPVKKEYAQEYKEVCLLGEWNRVRVDWFEPFIKGKHITWQQTLILLAVERALKWKGSRRISIASGHGIGKTAVLAWLQLWFLFCFKDAQVPCTAPTSDQLYDVLWKEIALWLDKMPPQIKALYDWNTTYVRIKERPDTWFSRAKTARKEAPEALAGIHGEYVLVEVDEASGVPEEIFRTAEGTLTNENILVLLISNPTRLIGYFYDSHHKDKKRWQYLQFNSEESPIVDRQFVETIIAKHGLDSDEYRIRVLGLFPKADAVDDKGYVPLLLESDLTYCPDAGGMNGDKWLGVDPSGEGNDETVWVVRDNFKAKIASVEKISTPKTIALKTLSVCEAFNIPPENVFIDNFGSGANVAQELALSHFMVNALNAGERTEEDSFLNKRAQAFWKLREWLKQGGELTRSDKWKELLNIRYRRELNGKLKIMSKQEMRQEGIESPNYADALSLTFVEPKKSDDLYEQMSGDEINNVVSIY